MIELKTVYFGKHGIVTDLGEAVRLLDSGGDANIQISRYGVWKLTSDKQKHEVVFNTSDLEAAKACADLDDRELENGEFARKLRMLEHGGEWCYSCNKQDYEQNMIWHNEHLYCSDCAPDQPAKFKDIAKALQTIHPEADVVNTGGGIDCIRVLVGHHALYFGTGGENWGASVYTILSSGNEVWVEGGDYDPNITMDISSDVPDAAKVAAAINAATDAFYSKHYVAHKPE